jgi:hypothetical protein
MADRTRIHTFVALMLAATTAPAGAATRAIRIDFGGDWADGLPIGSASCPGTSASNRLVLWNGFTFAGNSDPNFNFGVDTYCQQTTPFTQPGEPYFSNLSFFTGDENGLAALVGTNTNNAASAIRYTWLAGPRFSNPNGFQWAFYFFPSRQLTIVGLYGLTAIPLFDATSFISGPGGQQIWRGGSDGYDGEYFCFTGTGAGTTYAGEWNGLPSDTTSPCLTPFLVLFKNGFE